MRRPADAAVLEPERATAAEAPPPFPFEERVPHDRRGEVPGAHQMFTTTKPTSKDGMCT